MAVTKDMQVEYRKTWIWLAFVAVFAVLGWFGIKAPIPVFIWAGNRSVKYRILPHGKWQRPVFNHAPEDVLGGQP